MECNSCGIKKPKNDAKDFTKVVVENINPEEIVMFRKVVVPASMGDDTTNPPKAGKYHNVILYYEANDNIYLYSSDGIPTLVTANVDKIKAALNKEIADREAADNVLQQEIDDIKASPDVVDIVDTYADLQAYDTSKLGDNDIIRVLQDETHDGDSSYYKWNATSSTWTFIGSIDTSPAAFNPFPSSVVTDGTTQQFMSSILALQPDVGMAYLGTVSLSDMPAGLIQEEVEVYVYSDYVVYCVMRSTDVAPYQWWCASYNYHGWRPVGNSTITTFHWGGSPNYSMYKDSGYTTAATYSDIATAYANGLVYIADGEDEVTYVVVSDIPDAHTITVTGIGLPDNEGGANSYAYASSTWTKTVITFQKKLTAGSNIQINGTTISATDTTYSDFTGATYQQAGAHGLVPAPTTSDPDKFLKGDGTWGGVAKLEGSSSPSTLGTFYDYYVQSADGLKRIGLDIEVDDNTGEAKVAYLYMDDAYPLVNILPAEMTQEKLIAGTNISIAADGVTISATDTTYSTGTASTAGITKLYTTTGQNTDGAVTQKLFTDTVGDIEAALIILNSGAGVP